MQDYITGILEDIETVEAYHNIPFHRRLTVRTLVGKSLVIDDPTPLSQAMRVGRNYQLVVMAANIDRVRAFKNDPNLSIRFSGTIRQLKWQPTPDAYATYDADMLDKPMSIVATVYGHVLLTRMVLGGVAVGHAVTWGKDEFQLVAVYPDTTR